MRFAVFEVHPDSEERKGFFHALDDLEWSGELTGEEVERKKRAVGAV